MDKRGNTLRLSLGIPCQIGRLYDEHNRWEFSEGLIRRTDGSNIVLETQQRLMRNELIRIILQEISGSSFGNGDRRAVCTSGNDDRYREARVVRCCEMETEGKSGYEVSI